jgi:hypothetical protein
LAEFQRAYREAGDSARPVFIKYLPILGPATILDFLEATYPGCHAQSHELGQAVFVTTGSLEVALRQCDTRCTSGCMHGVVTAAFGNGTVADISSRMESFCRQGEMASLHKPGNCAHGVGHALMFVTGGDVHRSIDGCLGFSAESMQYYCGTGVFMERFVSDSARRRNAEALLSPCDEEALFPGACYRYKGVELWNSLGGADRVADECTRLEGLQRRGCFHGLGYAAIGTVLQDPAFIGGLCDTGTRDDQVVCIEGVIEKLADLNEGRARAACAFIENELRSVCDQAVQRKMYGLNKPTFALYFDAEAIARRRAAIPKSDLGHSPHGR